MLKIKWSHSANRRLDEIGSYIAADNPDAAGRVIARMYEVAGKLQHTPAMGHEGMVDGTREMLVAGLPYLIVYELIGDTVHILTVFHTSQQNG